MARTATPVNRELLVSILNQLEQNGPLANQSLLWKKAADEYNQQANVSISFSVVMLRATEWQLPIKTKGRTSGEKPQNESKEIPTPTPQVAPKPPQPDDQPYAPISRTSVPLTIVAYPAGEPHAPLKHYDTLSVQQWCDYNREEGAKKGLKYKASALIYWARYSNLDPKVFNKVRDIISSYLYDSDNPDD